MEIDILTVLKFYISFPLHIHFLRRNSKAGNIYKSFEKKTQKIFLCLINCSAGLTYLSFFIVTLLQICVVFFPLLNADLYMN
ncbi:hypothetical protein Avbf_01357 [Armadillidium vulgare]|nr:hypothetical protein Avbf_01357 [Armadillidium vulgare]